MSELIFESRSEGDTALLGAALADCLPDGTVIALSGPLGAGKTRLVQALASGLGVDPKEVMSPTFVLIQEHAGRRRLFHFDVYRLHDSDEFLALGPEEYFAAGGIVAIEWAGRVRDCLPTDRLEIEIEVSGSSSRRFRLRFVGDASQPAMLRLRELCEQSRRAG